jgi:hypothetical protein
VEGVGEGEMGMEAKAEIVVKTEPDAEL